ncbi:MAG TPA: cation diffusion facilitator family transporter [Steroidobacteraceae bacterium]|nr:cation diffusion facilitator family transporter [Steroidobacteraceae bacterium]
MARAPESKHAVYAALIGNFLVALTKAVAGMLTGSASMQSEAVHSFVDTGNELLLLYGMRRAAQRADPEHPLGYGRELYFWSFIVALLVFALGAGVSMYQGIAHLLHPEPIKDPLISYIVLGLSFLFEGGSWWVSWRQFKGAKGSQDVYTAFRRSKDPPSFMVLFEDTAALVGIVIAALATYFSTANDMPILDGIGSILIGIVLAITAILLARESKSLLIGERADHQLSDAIRWMAECEPNIARVNGVLTVQLGTNQILVALSLEFADELTATQIEEQFLALEKKILEARPDIVTLFIKPQTQRSFEDTLRRRFGDDESTRA